MSIEFSCDTSKQIDDILKNQNGALSEMLTALLTLKSYFETKECRCRFEAGLFLFKLAEYLNDIEEDHEEFFYKSLRDINIHEALSALVWLGLGIPNILQPKYYDKAFPVVADYILQLGKEKESYLSELNVRWKNPQTWKQFCKYDYRIDILNDSGISVNSLFELVVQIEGVEGDKRQCCLYESVCENLINRLNENIKFFYTATSTERFEDFNLSDNYFFDLWFKYVFIPETLKNGGVCYNEN